MTTERKMTLAEWFAVIGAAIGAFMAILDIQVTNASLREISGALGLDISESGWISTAYLIAEIIVIPLTAFFSDRYGIRRYLLFNAFGFVVASILCGFSNNLTALVICRILQGFTGGTLIPLSFQLILLLMPEKQKPLGMTIFGVTVTLAPTLGPTLGGWLTDVWGWRSIFFINIFPGLLMILLVNKGLTKVKEVDHVHKKLDPYSLITLIPGLGGLMFFLEEGPKNEWFDSMEIRVAFLMAIIFIPLFVVRQLTAEKPLLNLELFRNRNFAIGTVITTLAGCALFSGIYALSLYLSQIQDYSAPQIGAVLMWVGLPQLLVMPLVPFLIRFIDLRFLAIVGLLTFAYSNFLNSSLNLYFGGEELKQSLIVRALGQPLFVIPLSLVAMGTIRKDQAAEGSSIFNVMRNLGASLGIALTTTFVVDRQSLHFAQKLETYSASNFALVERIYTLDKEFKQVGLDADGAKHLTMRTVLTDPMRDSLIQSFSDVFWVLYVALVICCILVLFLRKVEAKEVSVAE